MDNSKTKMNLFEIPMQPNLHSECRNQCLHTTRGISNNAFIESISKIQTQFVCNISCLFTCSFIRLSGGISSLFDNPTRFDFSGFGFVPLRSGSVPLGLVY